MVASYQHVKKFGYFLFPEGDSFASPGLCGSALPWDKSGSILPIPDGDE